MTRGFRDEDRQSRSVTGVSLGNAQVIASTEKALRVQLDTGSKHWIPRSQIHDDSELYGNEPHNNSGELVVTAWFAEQERLV